MEQTVYVDLFFLVNFSMDFLCFFLTSKLLSHPPSTLRSIAASAFGGIYACLALFFGGEGVIVFLTDTASCVIMCFIAVYRKKGLRELLGYSVVYTAVSLLLGGVMTALFSLFNRMGLSRLFGVSGTGDTAPVWLFAVLAALSGILSLMCGRMFKKRTSRQNGEVEVIFKGRCIRLKALCDSGNLLREPVSGKPCIVADKNTVEAMLSLNVKNTADRMRIIPTRTAGGEGMLCAIRADRVRLNMGRGWSEADAYIALGELGESTQALVPSELLLSVP